MRSELPRVLLIDDEPAVHRAVVLRLRGVAAVTAAETAVGALHLVQSRQFDVALVDVNLGDGLRGTKLIPRLREIDADLAAIVFTAYGGYDTALDALECHSFDFIPKSLQDDREFLAKIQQGIAHTLGQRTKTGNERAARTLRNALADAVVTRELETTVQDIQRGFLEESLNSFSGVLGRLELLTEMLRRQRARSPQFNSAAAASEGVIAAMLNYIERLRGYFVEPGRATYSVNALLAQAERIVRDDPAFGCRVNRVEFKPDQSFRNDGRALLRATVILLRLLQRSAPDGAPLAVKASIVHQPAIELRLLGSRSWARVLRNPNFRKIEQPALAVAISGPGGHTTVQQAAALFAPADGVPQAFSPWSAIAMVARLDGALTVETLAHGELSYRILVRL